MVANTPPKSSNVGRPDLRRAILDEATALFAERGYAGVTLQDIAKAAGTYKANVLYHFPNKEALHDAVLDEGLGRMAEAMGEFMGGAFTRERVGYLLDQMQAFFVDHVPLARLLERELLESTDPEAYLSRFVEPIYVPAVSALTHAMDRGYIRRVDPALFIHDMHVQLIGYFCHRPLLERLRPGDPFSIDALIQRRDYLVDQIFRQLGPTEDFRFGGDGEAGGAP